jgi:predicted transcriptional regulator
MARRQAPALTDGEARLMHALWKRQSATVSDIVSDLAPTHQLTYSTVQTLLRILETKGYVAHDKAGRAFVYRPIVSRAQAQRRALRHLIARLFDNSPSDLVLNLLEGKDISPDELTRVRRLLEQGE